MGFKWEPSKREKLMMDANELKAKAIKLMAPRKIKIKEPKYTWPVILWVYNK